MDLDKVLEKCKGCQKSKEDCVECGLSRCKEHMYIHTEDSDSFGTCLSCISENKEFYRKALDYLNENDVEDSVIENCKECKSSEEDCIECGSLRCSKHLYEFDGDVTFGTCLMCISDNEEYYEGCLNFAK